MAKKWRVKELQNRLKRVQANISSAALYFTRKGKPIPFGFLNIPPPNTNLRRVPDPFTGGG